MHPRPASIRRALASVVVALGLLVGLSSCQPTPARPAPPATASVACPAPSTRSITIATVLAPKLRQLLTAAKAGGLALCGGGYRSPDAQVAVRRANCGPTAYDIWDKPASQCSPPTAKPGTSQHERGLAVDFDACQTRATACYRWLATHAAAYGLQNLPSEPWHWSTTGR